MCVVKSWLSIIIFDALFISFMLFNYLFNSLVRSVLRFSARGSMRGRRTLEMSSRTSMDVQVCEDEILMVDVYIDPIDCVCFEKLLCIMCVYSTKTDTSYP